MDDTSSTSRLLDGSAGRSGSASASGSGFGTGSGAGRPADTPLYNAAGQAQTSRILQLAVVGVVVLMVIITTILSIYRASTHSGLYFLLGLAVLLFVVIELLMVRFVRKGELPREKTWFLYFVGGCIILEALFTDILLFQ